MEIDIEARLEASLGKLTREMQEQRRWEAAAKRAEHPVYVHATAAAVANSSGVAVLRFDTRGPNQGYEWTLRRLAIGGNNPVTVAAGRADVFVTGMDLAQSSGLAQQGLQGWVDFIDGSTVKMPQVAYYGRGEIPLVANEELFVVITSGTNTQQYVAKALFEQTQLSVVTGQYSV